MRSCHPWLLIVALVACGGDKDPTDGPDGTPVDGDADTDADSDTDTDTDTDADADCTATITAIDPADGSFAIPLDVEITVSFSEPITAADPFDIAVSGATGTPTLAPDGASASWTGTLDYDTDYTISASVCDDTDSSDFHTLPEPVNPSAIEGNTFVLPWADLNITQPGNATALNTFIDVDYILAQVAAVNGATADAVATIAYDDGYGTPLPDCDVATEQVADFTLNPYFSINGTIELVINPNTGQSVNVENFELQARAAADGQSLTDITITGLVATEDILADADCNSILIALVSPTCLPCSTSLIPPYECLLFEADATSALVDPTIDLQGLCFP